MKDWIERIFPEHLEFLKTLAAIPAPSHDEGRRVRFLLDTLREMGCESAYEDGAKNVIIPVGEGERFTAYTAHTDVVFPDTEPLPIRQEGDTLYGPGVGDDTANVAAIVTMLRYIKEKGLKPKSPLLFVLNSCEEGLGNLKGVKQLCRDYEGRLAGLVSFDCSLEEGLVVRAVGSERWRVTAQTAGGHSYAAFGNANAIHRMAKLIEALYRQRMPELPHSRVTYNVGTITGGTSINTIAPFCEILYEYRSDNAYSLSLMRKSFLKLIEVAGDAETRFETELIGERPCGSGVPKQAQDALISRCAEAISAVTGETPERCSASTDANVPLSLGIPAVTFGLVNGGGAHTREEWLSVPSLKTGLEIGLKLILDEHFGGEA